MILRRTTITLVKLSSARSKYCKSLSPHRPKTQITKLIPPNHSFQFFNKNILNNIPFTNCLAVSIATHIRLQIKLKNY